jgi:hypothetical protein
MTPKVQIISSLFFGVLVMIFIFIQHPYTKIGGVFLLLAILVASFYAIFSLYNIEHKATRLYSIAVVVLFFFYQLYSLSMKQEGPLERTLFVSLTATGVIALIVKIVVSFFTKNVKPAIKVYTVTDEVIANYLVSLLLKNGIDAHIDKLRKDVDPIISPADSQVNIMIKNLQDYPTASKIIEEYFQEQENKSSWVCPKCHENLEGTFSVCWNCGYEKEDF